MYIKRVEIENVGPIERLSIELPTANGKPIPLVIVGENGSGKSILLSHIVNSLIVSRHEVYDDVELEKGKVFKYRSPTYIKSGEHYSYSSIEFDSGIYFKEWQLITTRENFESKLGYTPLRQEWNSIPQNETSRLDANFVHQKQLVEQLHKTQCCLYFPVNRFEEPAWLNSQNLTSKATYTELARLQGHSNRELICTSPLKKNRNWLLDLLFDRHVLEFSIKNTLLPINTPLNLVSLPLFKGFNGQAADIYNEVSKLLKIILNKPNENIRLGAGPRKNRVISILKDEKPWVPDLFQLSTGEALLTNLFLSIIKDYDLSEGNLESLADVKGIVVIDEIDSHLHTIHQKEVLPKLIATFPKVQFIVSSHSPMFLLGMEEHLGNEGLNVISLPTGKSISPSDFSEFEVAYNAFTQTQRHRDEISTALEARLAPILYVEGDYDIRYLSKAAELLGKTELIKKIQIKDGGGFGNLDKIWKAYDNALATLPPCKILLLYDCDIRRTTENKGNIFRAAMSSIGANPISVGIENLFPPNAIQRAEEAHPEFIDVTHGSISRIRGIESTVEIKRSANKDEKGNLCRWLCEHGSVEDFVNFQSIFNQIEGILLA